MKVLKVWTTVLIILTASVLATPFAHSNLRPSSPPATSLTASTDQVYQVSLDANSLSQTDLSIATNGTLGDIPPIASFIFQSTSNQTVISFDGSNSTDPDGTITAYLWNFDDGSSSTSSQAYTFHAYSQTGNYTVALTVVDNANLTGTVSHVVPVFAVGNDEPPFAILAWVPTSPAAGSNVYFMGNQSYDPDGYIQSWYWNFGDGYNSSGAVVVHSYSSPGTYSVTMTVVDNAGLSAQITVTLQVTPVQNDIPPVAIFTFSQGNASTGQSVFFNGAPSYDPDGYIQTWYWSFGDGATGYGPQISYSYASPGTYLVTLTVYDNAGLSATANAAISVRNDIPPVASFTFSPALPIVGQEVFFDGSSSFDPDGFIQSWSWDFGDGFRLLSFGPQIDHIYNTAGNYTATLTVAENGGMTNTATMTVLVHPRPMHDVAITQVSAYPQTVVSSQSVGIQIVVTNNGSNNETVSVAAYYGSHVIETLNGIFVPSRTCAFCYNYVYLQIAWDTTGVSAGNYTISATVFLPTDQNPSDNTMTDGHVQVLPSPILIVNPLSGPPGTTVVVHGSGFPEIPPYYRGGIGFVEVTFDDQLIGFTNSYEGQFNFTFSIPLSQQGPHLIKAIDEITGAHASIGFQVLAPPSSANLAMTVQVGSVYFPSDTAVIYIQVTLNGQPTSPSSFQLQLFLPNGSSRILTAQPIGPGLFKASYAVPRTGSLGTYLVLGRAHTSTPLDASTIASFEVKPSWLTQGGPAIAAALLGLVAVSWRKGYFKKEDYETLSTF